MRSRTAHQLDEVPIFACRVAVALDVADYFRVGLAGSVETEAGLNHVVLQVTVDGLGTTDNLYAVVLCSIVFSQYAGVRVGVVAADDNQRLDAQLFQNFITLLELVFLLQFRTA